MNDFDKFNKSNVYFKGKTFKSYYYIKVNIEMWGLGSNFIKPNVMKESFNFRYIND